jgi:phosphoglycerate dehydrogenase-like enzyme
VTLPLVALDERIPAEIEERLRASWRQCAFARGPAPGAAAFVHWGSAWRDVQPRVDELDGTLRWVHTWAAGVDDILCSAPGWLSRATLTSSRGAQARAVAEYALSRIVHAEWFRAPGHAPWRELNGRRLAVLGFGAIGRASARLGACLGMHVTALVRRRPVAGIEGADIAVAERWHGVLADADYLLVAVPLTPETAGLVDRSWFRALPRRAALVNVARGAVVVTDDLVDALRAGELAAAYLDVTDPEPLPEGHALRTLPGCSITPHIAGSSIETRARLLDILERNLAAFCAGGDYVNVIDPRRGY